MGKWYCVGVVGPDTIESFPEPFQDIVVVIRVPLEDLVSSPKPLTVLREAIEQGYGNIEKLWFRYKDRLVETEGV